MVRDVFNPLKGCASPTPIKLISQSVVTVNTVQSGLTPFRIMRVLSLREFLEPPFFMELLNEMILFRQIWATRPRHIALLEAVRRVSNEIPVPSHERQGNLLRA